MPKHNTYQIISRLDWIKAALKSGINCTDIATHWNISTKTARRDIVFLKENYGLKIEYDQSHKIFRLI